MCPNSKASNQAALKYSAILLAFLLLLYCAVFLLLPALPFLDLPNHIARNFIISELGRDAVFDSRFSFSPTFSPYVLGDILLSALISALGADSAARIWVLGSFLGFVAAASFYARAARMSAFSIRMIEIVSIFLATNWFFLSAFSHFVIGCWLSIFALGCAQLLLNSEAERPSVLRFLVYFLLVFSTYLMHLAAAVFCGLIAAALSAWRIKSEGTKLSKIAAVMLPHAATGFCYLLARASKSSDYYGWEFRSLWGKITAMGATFVRYDQWTDLAFTGAFLLLLYLFHKRTRLENPESQQRSRKEHTFVLGVLAAAYLALPVAVNTLSDIDTRALPYLAFFLTIAACSTAASASKHKELIALAASVTLLNFAYITYNLSQHSAFLTEYSEAFDHIPLHAKLFPVNTIPDRGRIQPSLHASMSSVPSRRTVVPYILSSNQGEPVTYFHYRTKLYEPNKFWYVRDKKVDWRQVAEEYDYVIVTRPHDQERIELSQFRVAFVNDSVVLYEVLKQ